MATAPPPTEGYDTHGGASTALPLDMRDHLGARGAARDTLTSGSVGGEAWECRDAVTGIAAPAQAAPPPAPAPAVAPASDEHAAALGTDAAVKDVHPPVPQLGPQAPAPAPLPQ